jgi:hypothetical protein
MTLSTPVCIRLLLRVRLFPWYSYILYGFASFFSLRAGNDFPLDKGSCATVKMTRNQTVILRDLAYGVRIVEDLAVDPCVTIVRPKFHHLARLNRSHQGLVCVASGRRLDLPFSARNRHGCGIFNNHVRCKFNHSDSVPESGQ